VHFRDTLGFVKGLVPRMSDEKNDAQAVRFSPAHDGLIIDGFLTGKMEMFRKLMALGFSRDEIVERAKQFGLSKQFIKRCGIGRPDVALRECLRCSELFLSVGFQNRLCNRCKARKW
jgi:hypothetical protein